MQTKDWNVNGKKGHLVHCGRFAEKALLQGHERNPIVNKISTIIHTNTKYLTYPAVLGMGRGKPRVTRGVSALGTQPSKFGWVGYPTQKICGSPGRPMGFSPPHPLGLAAAERA